MTEWAEYLKRVAGDTPQNKLAALAGVAPSQVSRWVAGSTVPSAKTVRQLAAGLGLPEYDAMTAAGHVEKAVQPSVPPASRAAAAPPDEFVSDFQSGVMEFYYLGAKTRHLSHVLLRARHGQLSPDWREHLVSGSARWAPDSPSANAEAIAIAELQNRPVELWEPHQASWRQSLDSWYIAARANACEGHINMERQQLQQISIGERLVGAYRKNNRLGAVLLSQVAPLDEQRDRSRQLYERVYITERTSLTASYLAGLAAGGLDIDWQTWYLGEIEKWAKDHPGRSRCNSEAQSRSFERLPEYWGWPDKASTEPSPPATNIVRLNELRPSDRLIALQRYGAGGEFVRFTEGAVIKNPGAVVDDMACIEFEGTDSRLYRGALYGDETLFHIERNAEGSAE